MSDHPPLRSVPTDRADADELRAALTTTRHRLLDVLHARARTLASVVTWVGPHRDQYDRDAAELLAAGRELDACLGGLLAALDAEEEPLPLPAAPGA